MKKIIGLFLLLFCACEADNLYSSAYCNFVFQASLYRTSALTKAITVIEQEVESCPEVEHFLRFLRDAERGICRSHRDADKV